MHLPEVVIQGQDIADGQLAHEHKAGAVGEG